MDTIPHVAKLFGQSFDPDAPSVLVTNDNIAQVWPQLSADRKAELVAGGYVLDLTPPPEPPAGEATPAPAPAESGEPAARARRTPSRSTSQE